ncbi:hypothetical protein Btru_033492 [Bulinus truncatus]|nr:hypothetical protein Btru_033492 [Bulinus truncatus]
MSKNISIETICQFASLASFHSLRPLLDNCVHFFIQHLEVISHRPDYKSILPAFMKRVFAMDDLVQVAPVGRDIMTAMDREIAVLGYVLKYLSHHVYDYVTCAEVFPMVRLNDITPTIVSHEMRSVRKLYRNTEVTRLVNLGRILFNLRDETLVEDPANCIPLSWRRHRVPAHFRVSSTPPRAFSILSIFEISKIVIGIRYDLHYLQKKNQYT